MFLKWSRDNTKVSKVDGAISFGLPAYESADGFKVCPGAGACAGVCYARQGAYTFPVVKEAREFNLAVIRKSVPGFKAKAMSDLRNMRKVKVVRIHDSGDLFSLEYLNAWKDIARAFPDLKFYTYTKSVTLPLYERKPKNLTIIQSEGGINDTLINLAKPHARIFSTNYQRRKAGYGDGHMTDTLAIRGAHRIGLIYHGTRDLTPAQKKYLDKV